jgi:hypothetical protein
MSDLNAIKKWLEIWADAAPELRALKRQELADPEYYARNLAALDSMLDYAVSHQNLNRACGLAEQQRLFKNLFVLLNGRGENA